MPWLLGTDSARNLHGLYRGQTDANFVSLNMYICPTVSAPKSRVAAACQIQESTCHIVRLKAGVDCVLSGLLDIFPQ